MIERLKRRRTETGFTLIELIVSLTILATITGAITATFLTANNANADVSDRIHASNDAQIIAGYWTADAQAAGGVNPALGTTDTSLGVSKTDDGGCGLGGGTLVSRFKWREWQSRSSTTTVDTYVTRVANYVFRPTASELERRTCANGTTTGVVTLATRVASAPTVQCDGSATCPALPGTVSITVTEASRSTYTFTLNATVRPDAQTTPGAGNAAGSPLLALGSTTCSGGTTGLSVSGNTTVVVNGQAAINATDVGACTAMTANGSIQYSANGTSLVPGGTCSGNQCPPTTTDATRLGDPFASLPVPGTCGGGGGNPAAGQPGTYRNPTTITGALAPGIYIFCSTVQFTGTITGTGVMLYFAGASSTLNLAGNVNIDLKAPTTGDYAGVLIWNATTNAVTINGNGTLANYNGALYSPNADVTVAGTSATYIGMIVAKRIFFSGNHTTDITNGQLTPGAPPLTAATGVALRQVRLTWTAPGYTGAIGNPITGYEYRFKTGAGAYGAWTAVPGGAAATTYDHTCGTSDTVPTSCTYQVRALNAQGAGTASAAATADSLADSTPPAVTVTTPAANATLGRTATFSGTAGNGAGDGNTITVAVYGSANCTGAPLATRTPNRTGATWTTIFTGLSDGARSVCATQSDWAGLTGTSAPVTFTVAPVVGLTATNANNRIAAGDTFAVWFGQAMNPASVCTGWNGTTVRTTLTVTVTNNDPTTGNNDSLSVTDSACAFNFGKINLGSQGWVTATTNFVGAGGNASTAVFDTGLTTLTIKLGTGTQGPNNVPASTWTYTPSTNMRDSLAVALSGAFAFPGLRF